MEMQIDMEKEIKRGRPKKDGVHISLYLRSDLMERTRALAEKQGWSLVTAFERAIMALLDKYEGTEE